MRLTKNNRERLLEKNEGFTKTTSYSSRNFKCTSHYKISDGKLYVRETGKTSWADSRFDDCDVCTEEQTHRFLRKYLDELNTDGIE